MRLVLTIRDVNVLDLKLWLPVHPSESGETPALEAGSGGQAERAEHYGDPATISGFGFRSTT